MNGYTLYAKLTDADASFAIIARIRLLFVDGANEAPAQSVTRSFGDAGTWRTAASDTPARYTSVSAT